MPLSQEAPDAEAIEDHELQYGHGPLTEEELDEKYPGRPRNKHKTPPFHDLFTTLFDPLNDIKKDKKPVGQVRRGPHKSNKLKPGEAKDDIIERFVSNWRNNVGHDFYPALRLILPDKDRDRAMYGLKEKAIGKLIVKMLGITPASEDGESLLNWKLPGKSTAASIAGDFTARCYEVLSKRPMRQEIGDMRIAEVNHLLDKLSVVSKEEEQLPIFKIFYERMNPKELQWLLRIILRQMKIGTSEKTILNFWHRDGEALFNVSSSLRRVCWELTDPTVLLEEDEKRINLMSCFQPQLAQFQAHSFEKMLDKMGIKVDSEGKYGEFWIEEKLDGERMQLHMIENEDVPGGKEFKFWSRRGTDYTYLYGAGFEDENSSLTRFIKDAFNPGVQNIILDGEMITWDPETDAMVGFGTLKSAALGQQRKPYEVTGQRPLFRVFDCLYLNGQDLTRYELRDRRRALDSSIDDVSRRLEVHKFQPETDPNKIDVALRKVIAEAGEGLVLKDPGSSYMVNERNNKWMKVKPEYMSEFGESLDCVVIGGYYGSGYKGGNLSSFLCGLRVSKNHIDEGADPMKCYSFFKVGGGFRAEDYAEIRHRTDGKWVPWDSRHPPADLIKLGGQERGLQHEKPDEWIKPCDSVVLNVRAASIGPSEQFGLGLTLRFPRFKKLRGDKTWEQALSIDEFMVLKSHVEAEAKGKAFNVEGKRGASKRIKVETKIAGNDSKINTRFAGPKTNIFEGLTFCIIGDMQHPVKKSKAELQEIIKSNGGSYVQSPTAAENIICISDKMLVRTKSLVGRGNTNIVRPKWILDAVKQTEVDGEWKARYLIPFEENHMFFTRQSSIGEIEGNSDMYGDPYFRDTSPEELRKLMEEMITPEHSSFSPTAFLSELEERGKGLGEVTASVFRHSVAWLVPGHKMEEEPELRLVRYQFLFGGGRIATSEDDEEVTHIVVMNEDRDLVRGVREKVARRRGRSPRIVGVGWVRESWGEKTMLDEEQFVV